MGNSIRECFEEFKSNGVSAVGANCTLDSSQMVELVKEMRQETPLPLIAQANAGQPSVSKDGKLLYSQDPEEYKKDVSTMIEQGVNIVGGCCGTGPEHIKKIAELIKTIQ